MHVFTNSFFQKGSKLNSALVAEAIHTLMLVLPHAFPWLRHTFQVWVHIICLVYKLHRHYRRVEKGLWIMVGLDFKPHLTAFTRVRVTNKITHLYADSQHIMPIKLWITVKQTSRNLDICSDRSIFFLEKQLGWIQIQCNQFSNHGRTVHLPTCSYTGGLISSKF